MLEPSTVARGEDQLTLFAEDFLARTSASQTRTDKASTEAAPDYGQSLPESLAKLDHDSCLWKTRQGLLFSDSTECLEICPEWGLMLDGELWAQVTPGWTTIANGFGFVPTPTKTNILSRDRVDSGDSHNNLVEWIYEREKIAGRNTIGNLNPVLTELLMDWPTNWTDLQPLAMDRFQQWLNSHGKP